MSHRRIVKCPRGWIVKESGTDRVLAEIPIDPVWERLQPAERTANELRNYPKLIDFLKHKSFHGDQEARQLLKELT